MSNAFQDLFDLLSTGLTSNEISLIAMFDEDGNISHVYDPASNLGNGLITNDEKYSPEPDVRDPDSVDKNGHPDHYLKKPVDLTLLKIASFEVLVIKGSKKRIIHAQGNLVPHP